MARSAAPAGQPPPAHATAPGDKHYALALYVVGSSLPSARAIVNVRRLCDEHLAGCYDLDVVDLTVDPSAAASAQIIAAPTLVKNMPPPVCRFVGDMSDAERILRRLGVLPRRADP